jgi:hypothetical protein
LNVRAQTLAIDGVGQTIVFCGLPAQPCSNSGGDCASSAEHAQAKACATQRAVLAIALTLVAPVLSVAQESLQRTAGHYQVTLRLPPEGVYAQEETEIEFRLEDTSRADPLTGYSPVIRAAIAVSVTMPAMSDMPPFQETAHAEDVPGDYGVHPTFAHGGDYVMRMNVTPPEGPPFQVEFPIAVQDAATGPKRKHPPPRFTLEVTSSPKTPKLDEESTLHFTVRDRERPKEALLQFDRFHEQLMHLVIVRNDLEGFTHEHPTLSEAGVFELHYRFAAAGEYHLFADVAPKGAGSQVLMAKLIVAGKPSRSPSPQRRPKTQEIDGIRIQLESDSVPAGKTAPVCFSVEPSTGLQPYLGARAHLIAIHQDALTFVHAHPDETKPGFVFQARFPKPGLYRVWLQFKRNGQLITAEFTIQAVA